ncbi:MAG TPA: alpha/beta hydrolase [Thermoanaerobaculia bacterium]|nr:alpha/beta hydrolase [Thermoanaerobaculia bacterium]
MAKTQRALWFALSLAMIAAAVPAEDTGRLIPLQVDPDVVYGHKMGMALTFDVLKPATANGAGVLFMVSGGWISNWSPPEQTAKRFDALLDHGFTVFAVRHGSSPLFKVPDAVDDVRRAARYIKANAREWGVDPDRLGVFGGSAGGHLSLMLGTTGDAGDPTASDPVLRESSKVAAVVAYFPPVDLTGIAGPSDRFPALDFDPAKSQSVSPIFFVTADDPPSLMVHGDQDELVPLRNSERILEAFKGAGVATELIVIAGGKHGFEGTHAVTARDAMVHWFETYLGSKPAAQPAPTGR